MKTTQTLKAMEGYASKFISQQKEMSFPSDEEIEKKVIFHANFISDGFTDENNKQAGIRLAVNFAKWMRNLFSNV